MDLEIIGKPTSDLDLKLFGGASNAHYQAICSKKVGDWATAIYWASIANALYREAGVSASPDAQLFYANQLIRELQFKEGVPYEKQLEMRDSALEKAEEIVVALKAACEKNQNYLYA